MESKSGCANRPREVLRQFPQDLLVAPAGAPGAGSGGESALVDRATERVDAL